MLWNMYNSLTQFAAVFAEAWRIDYLLRASATTRLLSSNPLGSVSFVRCGFGHSLLCNYRKASATV